MIIRANTIITGDGKTVLKNGGVRVKEGRIAAVGMADDLARENPADEIVDYGEATILPGLIDMHLHLAYWDSRKDEKLYTPHLVSYLALYNARKMLFGGVTTLRDAFCPDAVCRQLILASQKGFVMVPRIIHCNRALTITGGLDWNIDGTVQVDGAQAIRKAVREEMRAGASWIKAMTSWRTEGVAEFDQDELNMIVGEAHRRGLKAMAHATHEPSLRMCIDAGFDTIEHGTHLTVDDAKEMAEKNIALVPTIYVHKALHGRLVEKQRGGIKLTPREEETVRLYGKSLEAYKNNLPEIFETSLKILAGTDCPFDGLEDITVAWEMECLVELGMSPVRAIASGTSVSAEVLGLSGEIGVLSPGLAADIIIADKNADTDITALKRIRDVYLGGKKVHREI